MKFIIFLGALALFSCAGEGTYRESRSVIVGWAEDKYKIIGVDPPRHFHVSVQNLRTGRIYHNIGRRKRCNSWRNGPKMWEVVTIATIQHRDTVNNLLWEEPSERDVVQLYCN